jgi:hypothetical protein
MPSWQDQYLQEIQQAKFARHSGNEGRARVCARRAASLLISEYLTRQGLPVPSPSAQDRIRYLSALPGLPPAVYEITEHLLMHVDQTFNLPAHIDLIAEVERLPQALSL